MIKIAIRNLVIAVSLIIGFSSYAVADTFILKNGEKVEGKIVEDREVYVMVRLVNDQLKLIMRDEIQNIVTEKTEPLPGQKFASSCPDNVTLMAYMEGKIVGEEKTKMDATIAKCPEAQAIIRKLGISSSSSIQKQ